MRGVFPEGDEGDATHGRRAWDQAARVVSRPLSRLWREIIRMAVKIGGAGPKVKAEPDTVVSQLEINAQRAQTGSNVGSGKNSGSPILAIG